MKKINKLFSKFLISALSMIHYFINYDSNLLPSQTTRIDKIYALIDLDSQRVVDTGVTQSLATDPSSTKTLLTPLKVMPMKVKILVTKEIMCFPKPQLGRQGRYAKLGRYTKI